MGEITPYLVSFASAAEGLWIEAGNRQSRDGHPRALGMTGRSRVHPVAYCPMISKLRVMGRGLLTLNGGGGLFRALAYPFRCPFCPLGQNIAETFPPDELFRHGNDR